MMTPFQLIYGPSRTDLSLLRPAEIRQKRGSVEVA